MKKKRVRLQKYIDANIDNCTIQSRVDILNMITQKIGVNNIYYENTGTRILFKKISDYLLQEIANFIKEAIKETAINLSD